MKYLIIILLLLFSSAAQGQVYCNRQPIGAENAYITVMSTVESSIQGIRQIYSIYPSDTTGAWVSKKYKLPSKMMSALLGVAEQYQLSDSTGQKLPITHETALFNIMDSIGYEYLKKESVPVSTIGIKAYGFTPYTFKKKIK